MPALFILSEPFISVIAIFGGQNRISAVLLGSILTDITDLLGISLLYWKRTDLASITSRKMATKACFNHYTSMKRLNT